ncbi:putative E3 ubiquitin-protein ligase RF4 [Salvia divinorum]|uniref:E3 ubiquitin-protein ligase RF4 n=1 Tax=Salvia divinorum TaxID=28513 RepID=A0ABD1GVZ4_SALDI
MEWSEDTIIKEQDTEELQGPDWDNPVACHIEELLTKSLNATLCSAVKKIVESGYTEEVAERAILYSSLFSGSKDAVSNVVDSALTILKREKEISTTINHPVFEGLQSLVDYTLLTMICVLREVRPSLSVSEVMWRLLISDLNLVNACVADEGTVGGSCSQEASGDSQALPQSKSETSRTGQMKDSNDLGISKQIIPQDKDCEPLSPSAGLTDKDKLSSFIKEHFMSLSQGNTMDEKAVGNRKDLSDNSKRDMLGLKPFPIEKNYVCHMSKAAFMAKFPVVGSMTLDKSSRAQSGCASIAMKGAAVHSKFPTPAGTNTSASEGKQHSSSNLPSPLHPDGGSKGGADVSDTLKAKDYYSSIRFDETLQKYIAEDGKDESILILVPYKYEIEKELQGWAEWANEKVMQAAQRLGKDQAELKMLRQEKEEMEKFKKEKQALEDSTIKRLSELEYALTNATGQIQVANCTIARLEEENDLLMNDMEATKMQAMRVATDLHSAMEREQETLKKMQSLDADKGIVQDQLTNLKHQMTALNNRLEIARGRKDQFKALWKQEEKEKTKAQKKIDSLRKLEEEEASMKTEAENIKQAAEKEMQKCAEDIKRLQKMVMELSLESDKSKIADLNMGFPGSRLPNVTKRLAIFQDNFCEAPDVKPERECVMCLSNEISVVFIPCAHQVLCAQCNMVHEKQGMTDCPSCRTAIQKRVSISYRTD